MHCPSIACDTVSQAQSGNAVEYAKHRSRSHDAVIRLYDATGKPIETHDHAGDFGEP